ncbi:MAG: DUF438 domain-containing protein [Bacillota bacterium]|nr:DUF438 domain-containing protein [Bacillota bacterium]
MDIGPETKVGVLTERYPFLVEVIARQAPGLGKLRNPLLRRTFGRLATLADAAKLGGIDERALVEAVVEAVRNHAGPDAPGAAPRAAEAAGAAGAVQAAQPGTGDRAYRVGELKGILRELHAGHEPEALAERFEALLKDVGATEIAEAEQQLVAEGLPEEEIKLLCDVHAAVFRRQPGQKVQPADLPAGHPLEALRRENEALIALAGELRGILAELGPHPGRAAFEERRADLEAALSGLARTEQHYLSKEYRLFPILERHGAEAPPKVMWAVHDDIRALLKRAIAAVAAGDLDALAGAALELARQVEEMAFKEEQILFPLCLDLFAEEDWSALAAGERPGGSAQASGAGASHAGRAGQDLLPLHTGHLTVEQLNLLFDHLPVDLTVVDEEDRVLFYSEGRRVFPRAPEIIGRKVQNCHPPASVHVVERILASFKAGERDVAEFWLEYRGRFVHIRYMALRDDAGSYRGVLEVVQDATDVRGLSGQRRLLDW